MKGLFIPEITAEMFRNGCLESIETLMAEGEIYDIEYLLEQEPKTGYWIVVPGMNEQCSECGKFFPLSYFTDRPFEINYCPNCGCKLSEILTGSESEGMI